MAHDEPMSDEDLAKMGRATKWGRIVTTDMERRIQSGELSVGEAATALAIALVILNRATDTEAWVVGETIAAAEQAVDESIRLVQKVSH